MFKHKLVTRISLVGSKPIALAVFIVSLNAFASMPVQAQAQSGVSGRPAAELNVKSSDNDSKTGGALKISKVYFVSPNDGETVAPELTVKFAVEGYKVEKAGSMAPGTGHFHVLIDTPAIAEGQVIPTDAKHLHFGQAQTEAKLKLPSGSHTLVLQFADGAHRAYSKALTQEIKITVK